MRAGLLGAALLALAASATAAGEATRVTDPNGAFEIDLPPEFFLLARPQGPDFQVYDVMTGDKPVVGIYLGNHSMFPIERPATEKTTRTPGNPQTITRLAADGTSHVVEYLWTVNAPWPSEIHVWVNDLPAVDQPVAERIAASLKPAG